jgi:hypothetical protein
MKKILTIAALALLTLGGCNKNNEKEESGETTPNAASTQTWTFGDQIWSDAIQVPACNKSDFVVSSAYPDCRSYTDGSTTWHYYNWPYVRARQNEMCPAPWRVPSYEDFQRLIYETNFDRLLPTWGLNGNTWGTGVVGVGARAAYWSISTNGPSDAHMLYYQDGEWSVGSTWLYGGFMVRCVR